MSENLIEKTIQKIGLLRKVPQFIFNSEVSARAMVAVKDAIDKYKQEGLDSSEIDVILNSPGGSPDDAYRIIRSFRDNFDTVNIIVPFWAKSAATLLSLGASKIVMGQYGEFGPLDIQLGIMKDDGTGMQTESALNDEHSVARIEARYKEMYESMFIRLYEHKKVNINKNDLSNQLMDNLAKFYAPLLHQINPYKLGDKRRKLEIGEQYARRILLQYHGANIHPESIRRVVDFLINGCPDHGYIIDYHLMKPLLGDIVTSCDKFQNLNYEQLVSRLSSLFILDDTEDIDIRFVYVKKEIELQSVNNLQKSNNNTTFAPSKNQRNGKPKSSRKSTTSADLN